MKLSRSDVPPLAVIVAGGLVGFALTGALADGSSDPVDEHVDRVMVLEPGQARSAPRPIVYVDGVRIVTDERGLTDLAPHRIERVEIVKGSAAVALYGEEAEGGVIQIFTKKDPDAGSR